MGWRVIAAVIGPAVLAAGCTLAPDYQRPAPPVPDSWPDGPAYQAEAATPGARTAAGIGWREFFAGDAQLTGLIEQALQDNRDLRVAVLDVQRARAQYRIERAELLPDVDANASYTRQKTPAAGAGPAAAAGAGGAGTIEYYEAGVGITSYELDLFGRVRSLEAQALQEYLATFEARRSAQIALIAEVANAYLTYLTDHAQLRLARETLGNRRESLALVERRFEVGIASALDFNQARTAVENARSELIRFQRLVAQDRNALRVLIGGDLPPSLAGEPRLESLSFELPIPVELDSDLLLRRPDVLRAERELQAANASIGAARAAFFPRISLTGSYGSLSTDLDGLFEAGSEAWSFMPQISLPIFDGGRREAALDVAQLRKRSEIAQYERTIQEAFREVADALAARATLQEQRLAQQALVAATRESYRLSQRRFELGADNFLPVLDAQRELFAARQALIDVNLAILSNEIALYQRLGGGWHELSVPDSQTEGVENANKDPAAEDAANKQQKDG